MKKIVKFNFCVIKLRDELMVKNEETTNLCVIKAVTHWCKEERRAA